MARAVLNCDEKNPQLQKISHSKTFGTAIAIVNVFIRSYYKKSLHTLRYHAGTPVDRTMGIKVITKRNSDNLRGALKIPPWERNLLRQIKAVRKNLG